MAAKKKMMKKKKHARSKGTAGKKAMSMKKPPNKSAVPKKKSARKKPVHKKTAAKTKAVAKKPIGAKKVDAPNKRVRGKGLAFSLERPRARSAGQSGDLQGLSTVERADSESVDELLEEGNAFEADIVAGVEEAGNADEKEVRTHEVPEDDVPGEYLEKD